MIVLTLARKPLTVSVARNVLVQGTGGLNLDACRVGTFQNTTPSGANRFNAALAEQGGSPDAYEQPVKAPEGPAGRWPPNVILEHQRECRLEGETVVKTSTHFPASRGKGGLGTTGHSGQTGLVEMQPREERMPNWVCSPRCPVSVMGNQSGVSSSLGGEPLDGDRNRHGIFGKNLNYTRTGTGVGKGDTGTAARYFPQFKPLCPK